MNKNNQKKTQLPFRLNIVFIIIFLMFALLILQLGIVQIIEGKDFQTEIDRTIEDTTKVPVPRGKMYDREHKLVVDNEAMYSISYTPPKRVQAIHKLELAQKLVHYMKLDEPDLNRVTDRNKREYWYLMNKENAISRLSEKEQEELDDVEQYDLALERITDEEISDFSEEEIQVIAIKRELDRASALTPQVIKKENVTNEEYARIAENLSELPGINASIDWDRKLVAGEMLQSILGSITSQEQGIPLEKIDYYLSRGYSRNDRVGRNGLELQYEEVLRGRKEQVNYTTTKDGRVIDSEVIVEGERGKDLILTIDLDFQDEVDKIVREELKTLRSKSTRNRHAVDALAVVINPKTGEILALSGQHFNKEENEYENTPFKILYDSHEVGSTVKGATILAGLHYGAITPGQTFYDSPIKIRSTNVKRSHMAGIGNVNDISALKKSSNIYMFYTALRIIGDYRYPFPTNSAVNNFTPTEDFLKMRNIFRQFGLGVKTEIDFPSEATGLPESFDNAGKVLDFGIGQADTYTALQLAQYVSTIANDGIRIRPKLVNEIRHPSKDGVMGPVYQKRETDVLNELNIDKEYIKRVQTGFWQAFNERGGTGYSYWVNNKHNAAGKTGTAETIIDGESTVNFALVGYAPYDDPEVAFAIIAPYLGDIKGQHPIQHMIGTRIMDLYFKDKHLN